MAINETLNAGNATNILELATAINTDSGSFLFAGLLIVIFLILLSALSVYGMRNGFLASSAIITLLSIFLFILELISLYFVTFFIIMLIIAIILRVFGGE